MTSNLPPSDLLFE